MRTLGINAAFHDSAACLVEDGRVVAAAEEERFTRIKHAKRPTPFSAYELPFHAIDYCLREAGICLADVNHVAYSFDPHLLLHPEESLPSTMSLPLEPSGATAASEAEHDPWQPYFLASIVNAPRQLAGGVPHHLAERLTPDPERRPHWHFVPHHLAHAASALLASPFDQAAVMTLDGRGERATTSYWRGSGTELHPLGEVHLPHSLGLLYEEVTRYLGFLHSSDEYKVMALASFGQPRYVAEFHDIVELKSDGRYVVHPPRLAERFGPPRRRGGPWETRHRDIARSLQVVLEETVLELAQWLRQTSNQRHLCLAGGVALNCVMNAQLRDRGSFDCVWVQPAAGDAGTALGAALWLDARERGARRRDGPLQHAYLGPAFGDEEIERFLQWSRVPYRRLENVAEQAAELLARDAIIGWFQGRMEFGPRALGARSILASPVNPAMQARLNDIKDREDFRPVAPVILEAELLEWFVAQRPQPDPFMLFVHGVRPDKADRIAAVRHVDGTARVQTVNRHQNPLLHDLLDAFARRTGVPVLVNTSFNTRGEPIVCTPRDALESFWTSPLDALVIGSFLVDKRGGL